MAVMKLFALLVGTVVALQKTHRAPIEHLESLEGDILGLASDEEKDGEDAASEAATESNTPGYLISYFRHSFKTSGKQDFTGKLKDGYLPNMVESESKKVNTPEAVAEHFGSWTAHLAGQSKEKCPVAIGKMQKTWMGLEDDSDCFNLWSSKYHRVLGTGMQQSKGLQGVAVGAQNAFKEVDMPTVDNKCNVENYRGPHGCNDDSNADKEEAARRYLTDKLINNQKGQVSAWMVEHLRYYPDEAAAAEMATAEPEKCVNDVNSQSSWYTPKQEGCTEHDYHSEWDQNAWGTGSYDYKEHTEKWKKAHPQCVKLTNGGGPPRFTEEKMAPFMNGMVHDVTDDLTKADIADTIAERNCKPGYSCVVMPKEQRAKWVEWVNNNMKDQATTLSKLLDDNGEFQTEWPEELKTHYGLQGQPKWSEWLQSPTEWAAKQPQPVSWEEMGCVPGFSWGYAGSFGIVASSHFVNEISIQPQGCKFGPDGTTNYCTYANIVPECIGTKKDPKHLSNECIAAIDILYGIGWPGTYRAHALGYKNDIAVPSIALILGALMKRAYPDEYTELNTLYGKMLDEAGPPPTDGGYPGMPAKEAQSVPLRDDMEKVLLMSSHDITSNLMRITMQMAFPKDKVLKRKTFNDGSPTMMDNQIAYSAMFSFAVTGTKLKVKNFNMSLKQSALGCEEGTDGQLKHDKMGLVMDEIEVKEFVKTMAQTLHAKTKLKDMQATTMHSTVTNFLKAASECR